MEMPNILSADISTGGQVHMIHHNDPAPNTVLGMEQMLNKYL